MTTTKRISREYFAGVYMGVSKNRGTPKSCILIGCFHYKPSMFGVLPLFWGLTPIYIYIYVNK